MIEICRTLIALKLLPDWYPSIPFKAEMTIHCNS